MKQSSVLISFISITGFIFSYASDRPQLPPVQQTPVNLSEQLDKRFSEMLLLKGNATSIESSSDNDTDSNKSNSERTSPTHLPAASIYQTPPDSSPLSPSPFKKLLTVTPLSLDQDPHNEHLHSVHHVCNESTLHIPRSLSAKSLLEQQKQSSFSSNNGSLTPKQSSSSSNNGSLTPR